ncbi:MAG: porphobilinogen synthase [Methanomicrobiales archaeon]|nr:porphobilinogen synthase [Methanomicrobiales archaeon]MDI6876420.1 porphobilinogen synthase [Methanomicrobiales archaeon]
MFPERRLRRLRRKGICEILSENTVSRKDLIAPLFVDERAEEPVGIGSMPGQMRYPIDDTAERARELWEKGIRSILLFGIPAEKDAEGSSAWTEDGVVQQAVRRIRRNVPEMVICTDVCACEYTDHGHCGIVGDTHCGPDLLNDPSLAVMERIAVSHARAGADIVAPSCMLDGMVLSIRRALDAAAREDVLIMSYSTKFASAFYGPFREAAESGYAFGDRRSYQLNPANANEALRESEEDAMEGADILMVKPAGFYLDVLAGVKTLGLPVAAYQVSGEYAMIRAAAERGWLDEKAAVLETLTCLKRAGADLIVTYFADEAAGWIP